MVFQDAPVNCMFFLIPFLSLRHVLTVIVMQRHCIEGTVDWQTARNNCYNFGGNLVELETKEENDFIKTALTDRNAVMYTVYFLGGYKFHANNGIRWINSPSQAITFRDWAAGEPNNLCLGFYGHVNFPWIDCPCNWLKSYICEFKEYNVLNEYKNDKLIGTIKYACNVVRFMPFPIFLAFGCTKMY